MSTASTAFANPPQQWLFNENDRKRFGGRFWRMPIRLVTTGLLAKWWREDGTRRGGGVLPSILPVLALHTWPGKEYTGRHQDGGESESAAWSTWHYLSQRRIAALAGVNTETVGKVLGRLKELGLLQRRKMPPEKYVGGPTRYEYRLSAMLYVASRGGAVLERYAGIPAELFYNGAWALLPTPAARQLYLTIAALDPVLNEVAMQSRLEENNYSRDLGDAAPDLRDIRERHPRSLAELCEASGMKRSAVEEALEILLTPLFWRSGEKKGPIDMALIAAGPAAGPAGRNGVRWFSVERKAMTWFWNDDALNGREKKLHTQKQHWPKLAQRRADQRKRSTEKKATQERARRFKQAVLKGAAREAHGKRMAAG